MIFSGLLFIVAGAAVAGESGIKVGISDLDLNKREDVAILYKRLQHATHLLCDDNAEPWDGRASKHYQMCLKNSLDQAVRSANNARLTAMHRHLEFDIAKH